MISLHMIVACLVAMVRSFLSTRAGLGCKRYADYAYGLLVIADESAPTGMG
jgi:hypothetical protein